MALKSFDTAAAIDDLAATGFQVPPILSLQNGVDNEPTIAARLGAEKVIAGTVTTAIAKPGPGEVIEEKHRGVGVALGHPAPKTSSVPSTRPASPRAPSPMPRR